ncbi:MAG TPA: mevalonate kinase [Anaerolineales bacterium]|nr:mevalonate kinase [Anaerolineales bacterium]
MPAYTASAPGKIILLGEHAVVYGQPAIAVPVIQVHVRAVVTADPRQPAGLVHIQAPEIGLDTELDQLPADDPLAAVIHGVFKELGIARPPALSVRVVSTIPVASGLGSGAAVSVAIIRALAAFLGHLLPDERVAALAYEVEKIHHGTPSGIDNSVVTYARPVYFTRVRGLGEQFIPQIETFQVGRPFEILIADTGVSSPTALAVGDVRHAWQAEPDRYQGLFATIGKVVQAGRQAIEKGRLEQLGRLMDENHALLTQIGVSSPELDRLVESAREAGAFGAKLSGSGRGGNMISLAPPDGALAIERALRAAGATRTILTRVE